MKKYIKLILAIILCQTAGIIGSVFTFPSIKSWYFTLNKPSFTPPSWLFGPAWVTLYTLMGISLYQIWEIKSKKPTKKKALNIFYLQLALNALWSIIFFGLRQPLWGLIEIVFLWLTICLTIIKFYRLKKSAGLILVPYLLWVSFASVLNFYIYILNR